jgi:DNA-binding MarR family transcriptional regulator
VLSAIEANSGATLEELVAATSWLPHTTRAAISRLRQRGYAIRLMEQGGRKAYRLAA